MTPTIVATKDALTIRLEKKEEQREVENLIRESFWNVYRPGCYEHYVMHVLRDDPDFIKQLNFVMEKDGKLIGQNMFMRTIIKADNGIDGISSGRYNVDEETVKQLLEALEVRFRF